MGPAYLAPVSISEEGYSTTDDEAVFENKAVKITLRPVKPKELEAGPALLAELLKRGYMIVNLEIVNKSSSKVMYNPGYTVLTNNLMYYKKPLDFTDLYDIVSADEGFEKDLRGLKGKFYDLNVVMYPNAKVSKFLIFGKVSDGAFRAGLKIQELYIGTNVISAEFPFKFKTDKEED